MVYITIKIWFFGLQIKSNEEESEEDEEKKSTSLDKNNLYISKIGRPPSNDGSSEEEEIALPPSLTPTKKKPLKKGDLSVDLYPYQWIEKNSASRDGYDLELTTEDEVLAFCLDSEGEIMCLRVTEFRPFFYIKVEDYDFATESLKTFSYKIKKVNRRPLYYHSKQPKQYYLLTFRSNIDRVKAKYKLNYMNITMFEEKATSIQQLTATRDLPMSGAWISTNAALLLPKNKRISSCNKEYLTSFNSLSKAENKELSPPISTLSWDIECYSSNANRMPDAAKLEDVVFQISLVYQSSTETKSIVLALNKIDESAVDAKVKICKGEKELLQQFSKTIRDLNPTVLIGYNIFNFDLPYLHKRAIIHKCESKFLQHSCIKNKPIEVDDSSTWSNGAINYYTLKLAGRLYIDLFPLINKDYKLDNYKLDTVAKYFLQESKDDFTPQQIFSAWENKDVKELAQCAKYCLQDSNLVLKLFNNLNVWTSLTQMSLISHLDIYSLLIRGQQAKVWTMLYREAFSREMVVDFPSSSSSETKEQTFQGALVLEPKKGLYDDVAVFDFQSLYPTAMVAYNIDYSTLIQDHELPAYSEKDYNAIEWTEGDKNYKFCYYNKEKGVIPTIQERLLQERQQTKQKMQKLPKDASEYKVLEKRQLAYKLCSNSIYGSVASSTGKCPLLPLGMSTTAIGRECLKKAVEHFKDKSEVIYGDTDSVFLKFKDSKDLKSLCEREEKEIDSNKIFPRPMKLEFEGIYSKFLILSKKRYVYTSPLSPEKIEAKGVSLGAKGHRGGG